MSLHEDLEDALIHDFLERGTTWEQVKTALLEIANGPDPREQFRPKKCSLSAYTVKKISDVEFSEKWKNLNEVLVMLEAMVLAIEPDYLINNNWLKTDEEWGVFFKKLFTKYSKPQTA